MTLTKAIIASFATTALPLLASAATLSLSVDNIETHEGVLQIGLFDAAGYQTGDVIDAETIRVNGDKVVVTFDGIAPGEYAVKLFQDLDEDGELDTNMMGIPKEPYAFSNNARGRFGPAKWDAAKFSISEAGTAHTITLK